MIFNVHDLPEEKVTKVREFLNENDIKFKEESSGFMAFLSELAYNHLQMYQTENKIEDSEFINNNLETVKDLLFKSDEEDLSFIDYDSSYSILRLNSDKLKIKEQQILSKTNINLDKYIDKNNGRISQILSKIKINK